VFRSRENDNHVKINLILNNKIKKKSIDLKKKKRKKERKSRRSASSFNFVFNVDNLARNQ